MVQMDKYVPAIAMVMILAHLRIQNNPILKNPAQVAGFLFKNKKTTSIQ